MVPGYPAGIIVRGLEHSATHTKLKLNYCIRYRIQYYTVLVLCETLRAKMSLSHPAQFR